MMEPASTGNPDLPLLIALVAVIAGPAVAYVVGLLQEKGAAKRFNAEATWRLAQEFRVEYAAFSSACFNVSMAIIELQTFVSKDSSKIKPEFPAKLKEVIFAITDLGRMALAVGLLLDPKSEFDTAFSKRICDIAPSLLKSFSANTDRGIIFEIEFDGSDFRRTLDYSSVEAREILRHMQRVV